MRTFRSRVSSNTAFTAVVAAALLFSGCSKFMGNLRPDLDDSSAQSGPTQGGTWPEHGFLADDTPENPGAERYSSVGHSERGIASVGSGQDSGNSAWYSEKDANNNARDSMRGDGNGDPAFSSSPNLDPPTKRLYRNGNRATRADFVDDSQNEGSLWASDGQTNYYFTKNKIRGVGDIVSVKMETGIVKDLSTEIKRTLSSSEKDYELAMAQDRIRAKALGAADPTQTAAAGGAPGAAPDAGRAPASVASNSAAANAALDASLPQATTNDIDVSKSIDIKENDLMMAEIVERFPNGNYKIRGTKRVQYKGGYPRLITMMGVARGADIAEDDVIPSGKLYEYRLEALR